jgi:polysaccharide biosynthesis/export protein
MICLRLAVALAATLTPAVAAPGYCVGPGDVLEVSVPGAPEASRLVTVQTSGAIFLPPAGEVPVRGLTVEEIGLKLARPGVRVSVREYRSQFVWMTGEVVRRGRTPLRGATRLVDALVAAGGLTEAASGEVVVERREGPFADGSTVKSFFLSGSPTALELSALETRLAARDVVTARKVWYVHVSGAVARPGRYPLRRGTLTEALSAAGGMTKLAGPLVKVSRIDPQIGSTQVIELAPSTDPDAHLLSDDQVLVPTRR